MTQQKKLTVLTEEQIKAVSGAGIGDFFEVTHHFVGFREFVNYVADLYYNGAEGIDEKDYFSKFFVALVAK